MKISLLLLFILTAAVGGTAQTESKCFRSEWLQGERSVKLKISGNRVSGTFVVESGDDSVAKTYPFGGKRRGKVLTVAFVDNKRPDVSPSELKSLVWKLIRKDNREYLRIKVFGKNYKTNKYEESFVDFEPCEAN